MTKPRQDKFLEFLRRPGRPEKLAALIERGRWLAGKTTTAVEQALHRCALPSASDYAKLRRRLETRAAQARRINLRLEEHLRRRPKTKPRQ